MGEETEPKAAGSAQAINPPKRGPGRPPGAKNKGPTKARTPAAVKAAKVQKQVQQVREGIVPPKLPQVVADPESFPVKKKQERDALQAQIEAQRAIEQNYAPPQLLEKVAQGFAIVHGGQLILATFQQRLDINRDLFKQLAPKLKPLSLLDALTEDEVDEAIESHRASAAKTAVGNSADGEAQACDAPGTDGSTRSGPSGDGAAHAAGATAA